MAEYDLQDNRRYPPNPNSRAASYGTGRDAAFANVFGGPPPPRSSTMTSATPDYLHERAPSLTANSPNGYSPQRERLPPQRQMHSGYLRATSNGYGPDSGMPQANGYPSSRPPPPQMSQVFNDGRGYPPPSRMDPRSQGQMPPYQQKPGPNRMPPPAMNSDPYRSQSMMRPGEVPMYRPPGYQPGTAGYNRQQQYTGNQGGSMTAQGRQIPQRMGDERAMTMGNLMAEREQLTSGRILPARRRESESEQFPERSATFTSATVALSLIHI